MATSSGILHSFLNDKLNKNKKVADLHFKDFLKLRKELLEYNRAECGLIEVDFDPSNKFTEVTPLLYNKNMVIAYQDKLYYADVKNQKVIALEKTKSNRDDYEQLKRKCTSSYKRAKGHTLDLVRSVTGRSFNAHRSADFLPSLNFYLGVLGDTDKVMFAYMSDEQKEQLRFDLKMTLLLLLAQQQHEIDYQKTENRKAYTQHIKRCVEFLLELDPEYQNFIIKSPEQTELSKDQPLKYLGWVVGHELGQKIVDWTDTKTEKGATKTIKEYMGSLNEKRLNWVWESTFLKTVIDLVPKDHPNAGQAAQAIRYPDPYTGTLSWALYYARFALNLSLLLKHTIKGPWMSEEEAKMPWYERFQTQWDQRKFSLLNDSLWGTANLVCFFWLTGKSILGTWGDAITVALLIFDISIAIWDFEEQKTKYNKAMLQYSEDIARIEKRLKVLKGNQQQEGKQERATEERQLEMQLHALRREQAKCSREWQMNKLSLISSIAYAVGLMLAFVVLTMPFLPVAAPVAATLALVGAVVCLAFTMIYNAVKGGIELYATHQTRKEIKEEYDLKVSILKRDGHKLTEKERKLLFLEIKKLKAETEYQKQMMIYQSVNLIRGIALDIFIPAVVFISLVCMPLGFGILTIGAALGFALGSRALVDSLFKPEEKKALEFDQQEYTKFYTSLHEVETKKPHGFFKKTSVEQMKKPLLDEKDFDSSMDSEEGPLYSN
ncbi:putative secreted esterase [Legionella santicrucis]|uniref:Putative secreted esterase n=1 Tax=Legionella santicrucis TaxID=45074 RepID=A0A0W0ZF03_9GAMM|nr:hypothetical protein [Legionella santicrucis]KTD67486.1 putative secreted esterase [Legionella santicrucis]